MRDSVIEELERALAENKQTIVECRATMEQTKQNFETIHKQNKELSETAKLQCILSK